MKDGVYFENGAWVAYHLGNDIGQADTKAEAVAIYDAFDLEFELCCGTAE